MSLFCDVVLNQRRDLCTAFADNGHRIDMLFQKPSWVTYADYYLIINCTSWNVTFDKYYLDFKVEDQTLVSSVPFFAGPYFAAINNGTEDNCFDVILFSREHLNSVLVGRTQEEKCNKSVEMDDSIDVSKYRTIRTVTVSGLIKYGLDSWERPIAYRAPHIDALQNFTMIYMWDAEGNHSTLSVKLFKEKDNKDNFRVEKAEDQKGSSFFSSQQFRGLNIPYQVIAIWAQRDDYEDGYLLLLQDNKRLLYCWIRAEEFGNPDAQVRLSMTRRDQLNLYFTVFDQSIARLHQQNRTHTIR